MIFPIWPLLPVLKLCCDTGEVPSCGAHLCAIGQHGSSPSGGTVRAATWVPLVTAKCVCLLWLRHTGQI